MQKNSFENQGIRESLLQYDPPIDSKKDSHQKGLLQLDQKPSNEDLLHQLLPPRELKEIGQIQYVSAKTASREDVANLQKLLDERLLARQARQFSYLFKLINQKEKMEFVLFEKSFIINVLMKLLDKLLQIAQIEVILLLKILQNN